MNCLLCGSSYRMEDGYISKQVEKYSKNGELFQVKPFQQELEQDISQLRCINVHETLIAEVNFSDEHSGPYFESKMRAF